ncbi:hypothetical protein UlMin_024543 [Ulmus minor]
MSGGVGPPCDISLPAEEEAEFKEKNDSSSSKNQNQKAAGYFSFRQLNSLAVIIILSASGMVGFEDFAFVFFSNIYIYFLSKVAFPSRNPSNEPPVFNPQSKILRIYVSVGAIIGLFLPIAYIFEGILEGDKEGIKAAAPHVFLLASQIFMEGVVFSGRYSTPLRAFVPISYNSSRIFSIMEWLRTEFSKTSADFSGSQRRFYVGRGLALANMAFWSFNLFGFLLPVYLPKALARYYNDNKLKD